MMPILLTIALAGAAPAAPSLVGLSVTGSSTGVTLRFEASATIPTPEVRQLQNPARLYFDLPGFVPGRTRHWAVDLGAVRQVRTALNQPAPPLTRVVIDLDAAASWRVEQSPSGLEFSVIVSSPAVPAAVASGPPPLDRTRQIAGRLYSLGPALEAMRAWTGPSDAELTTVIAEAEALAAGARAARLSGTREALLVSGAAEAVLAAAKARAAALGDGTEQSRLNAISAAAGALLLMDYSKRF
jgi:hypothetical protein